MKKVFLLFASVLAINLTNAQIKTSEEFNITTSKPYQVHNGGKDYFSKNGEVLAVKTMRDGFLLQKFSGHQLNEVERNEQLGLPDGFVMEALVEINEKFYLFYSVWDKKNEKEQLFKREIDFDEAKFINEGELVFQVDGKVSGYRYGSVFGFSVGTADKFDFYTTFDETKLIVQYRKVPVVKRDSQNKDIIGMYVFDSNIEEIWHDDVTMPYTEANMNNIGYAVNESGDGLILCEVFKEGNNKRFDRDGNPNFRYEILKIDGSSRKITKNKLDLNTKFIKDVGFFEGSKKEVVLAGYYGKDRKSGTEGIFVFKIDENGDVKDQVEYEIPVKVMSMYMSERAQKKMEKKDEKGGVSMSNMVLRDIVYGESGAVTLIGEEYYVVSHYNAQTKQTTYTYHYEDMLMTRINADGSLAWMTKLPKRQKGGSGRGGMGYFHMIGKGSNYVIFMDNVKNMDLELTEVPALHADGRGGYLTGFKVDDESGKITKVSLFNTADFNGMSLYQFNTGRIVKINDQEFAVEFYKKKKEDVMIKVSIEE